MKLIDIFLEASFMRNVYNKVLEKKRLIRKIVFTFSLTLIIILIPYYIQAQSPSSNNQSPNQAPVTLEGKALFFLQDKFVSSSVTQRAQRASSRIQAVANDPAVAVDAIQATPLENNTLIHAEDILILAISDGDAKIANLSRQALANKYLQIIKNSISEYREEHSALLLTRAVFIAFLCTIALIITLFIIGKLMPRFYHWLDRELHRRIPNIRIQRVELLTSQQISAFLQFLTSIIQSILVFSLLFFYLSFVLSLFPLTRQVGQRLFSRLQVILESIWNSFINYLPNFLTIALIILLTHYFLRFLKFISTQISRGVISIPEFYPEWAEPTYQLLMLLTIAIALASIFPYTPFSDVPSFQAVGIFLGALVSLGSSTAISNIIAGYILIYTRAFQRGDRIQMGDVAGFVEEKMPISTRIRTIDNIVVTVPNSTLLTGNIINYSALLRDKQTSVILHTTVTLGYDAPWRTVHQTLMTAALATPGIQPDPAPFVLQTALNDFYVEYELRACTNLPLEMERIYSELHQNIQDKCNEVGIEICSPHYSALRDGNQTTIPDNYLPKNYKAPGFRINPPSKLPHENSSSTNSQASQQEDSH